MTGWLVGMCAELDNLTCPPVPHKSSSHTQLSSGLPLKWPDMTVKRVRLCAVTPIEEMSLPRLTQVYPGL